jgi:SpoVK/Ycf46/Vps4 family AAA+-type ATPase
LAKDEYERNFISAVVPPNEIGVKFDDIGALEDVKRTLDELVTLPMRRPELFSHGNLLRVWLAFFPIIFFTSYLLISVDLIYLLTDSFFVSPCTS